MPVLFRDFETRSTSRLADAGAWRYAADPSTEILCVGFAVDDGPVELWTPDQPVPEVFKIAAADPEWVVAAHHDQFESAIEERLLHPRYGWPIVPIGRHRCTMAMALAAALPASLEGAAAALDLPVQKDAAGRLLMTQMAKPRRPRKNEDPSLTYWHDDLERRLRLAEYCRRDVETERELYRRSPPLSDAEQAVWTLDAEINRRGFHVDRHLAEAARRIVEAEQDNINARVAEITGGAVTSVDQVARIKELAGVTSLTKTAVATAIGAAEGDDAATALLGLRAEGGKASARKLDTLLASLDADDRIRGCFRFHGASTGRWSGQRFQPQNLAKEFKATGAAVAAISAGDVEGLRQLGPPLAVVGAVSRALITAAPGNVLIGADYSAIESRALAWLSGERWKLEVYRRFDETGDPALEPYCVTASKLLKRKVTPADEAGRAIGKVADLACGFGGGLGAWKRFATTDQRTDDEIKADVSAWRSAHPATVAFWNNLEGAMRRAIRCGSATLRSLTFAFENGVLYLVLPSGRRLAYPKARIIPGKHAPQIAFHDNASGKWSEVHGWRGTFVENAIQAISRDILAEAMLRLDAAGFQIALHVHDEIVCEVPEGTGTDELLRLMTQLPLWAAGLPLAAKAWANSRYTKTPTPAISSAAGESSVAADQSTIGSQAACVSGGASLNIPKALPKPPATSSKIRCPFHDDGTPSMQIYEEHAHCYGCGAHVDLVDFVMMTEDVDRAEAERLLADGLLHKVRQRERDPEENAATLMFAAQLWDRAKPIAGTAAARYLADVRGVDIDLLPDNVDETLRFHAHCPFGSGARLPCLIALYRDVSTDAPAGIHRIALTDDVLLAGGKVQRRTLGAWPTPRAVKLWPATDQLFLGEGIETVLAAATRLHYRDAPMRPAWAAGSSNNITKFPVLHDVQSLTLLVDHDPAGEKCTAACRLTWRAAGRKVTRLQTDHLGTDFNDLVLERCAS